jgi:hypothetical protein
LSSLDVGVFNRVFTCENAHELWKTIKEQNESSKEIANERYCCLLEEFNSFKQLANENAESMYSRLNVLVNEINALGVKDITDLNINRKILQSLRKPDYDLVKAIIYEKKLEELKSSHILSKIMAHELQLMPKSKKVPQEPSSPTTSHALSSQQGKLSSRMATHGSSSEDDGDDGDDGESSSDEEVESMVAEYVKKIFKYVKKVNMYGYNVHLREGVIINTSSSPRSSTSLRRRLSRKGDQGKEQLSTSVIGQVVENQVLLAQAMNQEGTSPPASCMVPHHHHTCGLWPKVWKAM